MIPHNSAAQWINIFEGVQFRKNKCIKYFLTWKWGVGEYKRNKKLKEGFIPGVTQYFANWTTMSWIRGYVRFGSLVRVEVSEIQGENS